MEKPFNPRNNFNKTKKIIGYVPRKQAKQQTYDHIGFISGLEVHQQLLTSEKLFCHCPSGIYQSHDDYDAELIRHMRPTLSELGEYDGTALMEFKTRKEIVYHIKNETACTYDVDDTPPFPINREALDIAIQISLLSKLNIVGEVHITRKQYLDGSIPTGFQRTAIIGVEGEIYLKHKKVRLIQLSLEEDSCREVSDIRHTRVFKTDRLGMPLIETVTYPDCMNPDEVREACDYIRFLNRSTGKVRTGIGSGRQDVNVSCKGGTRVEIKGVAHTKWIPELTHNECFRQWALLEIRKQLLKKIKDTSHWNIQHMVLDYRDFITDYEALKQAKINDYILVGINLPGFHGLLSHFTQPGKMFADEISDRLKVVACLEKPHMLHSEEFNSPVNEDLFIQLRGMLHSADEDAQLMFWGPEEDIKTALETIEERCQMAFEGVPRETRKSFENGTTIFERVLPGADRMYPDTDSPPIPLEDEHIQNLSKDIPKDIIERYKQLQKWEIPEDTYTYIFKNNYYPVIEKIINELKIKSSFVGTFFGHTLKYIEGHFQSSADFSPNSIFEMFRCLKERHLDVRLAKKMISEIYEHPKMDFDSVLTTLKFKDIPKEEILLKIPFLKEKFQEARISGKDGLEASWIMGQLKEIAVGNIDLTELYHHIVK